MKNKSRPMCCTSFFRMAFIFAICPFFAGCTSDQAVAPDVDQPEVSLPPSTCTQADDAFNKYINSLPDELLARTGQQRIAHIGRAIHCLQQLSPADQTEFSNNLLLYFEADSLRMLAEDEIETNRLPAIANIGLALQKLETVTSAIPPTHTSLLQVVENEKGMCHEVLEEFQDAEKHYRESIKLSSSRWAIPLANLANIKLKRNQDSAAAKQLYSTALSLNSDLLSAKLGLGSIKVNDPGTLQEGITILTELRDSHGDIPEIIYAYARGKLIESHYDYTTLQGSTAKISLEKAVSNSTPRIQAISRFAIGYTYESAPLAQRDIPQAIARYRTIRDLEIEKTDIDDAVERRIAGASLHGDSNVLQETREEYSSKISNSSGGWRTATAPTFASALHLGVQGWNGKFIARMGQISDLCEKAKFLNDIVESLSALEDEQSILNLLTAANTIQLVRQKAEMGFIAVTGLLINNFRGDYCNYLNDITPSGPPATAQKYRNDLLYLLSTRPDTKQLITNQSYCNYAPGIEYTPICNFITD